MKLAAMSLALAGCAMFSTREETATRDMRLWVTIDSSDDAGTHVNALLDGPFGDPDLGPNDSFSLEIDGAPTPLSPASSGLVADVPTRGGEFAFVLHHDGDHDVTSLATLPPPSNVHGASAGGKLAIDWTPTTLADVTTTLTVKGTCIEPQSIAIRTDTGHYELLASQLQTLPASCAITLGLARALETTTTAFGAAFMDAKITQSETAEATWTP
jgi:hypothetical protein